MAQPLDLIAEARRQWEKRWGSSPAVPMAAVTSIMRVEQLLMAELNELLRPFDLPFPRSEALMLLSFSKKGELPLGKVGERLQVHRMSGQPGVGLDLAAHALEVVLFRGGH